MIALSLALGFWAWVAFAFTVEAARQVRKLHARSSGAARTVERWPSLQILRPCEGLDLELEDNLLSAATARYAGARSLWLLVPSTGDPAHAVAERVRARAAAEAPGVPVHVLATGIETAHNRKVAQLAVAPAGDEELVVIADSDLRISDETLPALVGVLAADPQAGASHAAQIERRADTIGDQASAALLSSTPHAFLCLAALAERNQREQAMCGALVAIRRPLLDEVGGFASLEEFLGEDFELARRIHELGRRAPISPEPVEAVAAGRGFAGVAARFARWSTVTRTQKPHLYVTYLLLLGCAPPLFLLTALTAALQPPLWWFGLGWAALFFTARITLASMLRRRSHLPAGPLRSLAALLLGETLLLIGATGGLGRPIIEWRGHRFRIEKGGKMLRL